MQNVMAFRDRSRSLDAFEGPRFADHSSGYLSELFRLCLVGQASSGDVSARRSIVAVTAALGSIEPRRPSRARALDTAARVARVLLKVHRAAVQPRPLRQRVARRAA